ncbi:PqqD family protein [Euryarchaeota archaeon ex4484_162]|nr:PqqD family protein [Thermoplasmata archaeon]OYT56823.1 MAG: PqqD family protein [Euryarchaeota archaeon ex4484_162]HDO70380.1 PqqD family protein [Thermoplasmatales archaeon]RLF30762.1 MAG: PqqD family protein [Thermoplasmata archaeon]RLF62238.1 MAG: PqqD family protein [Thermoplasmata archaeon]
MLKKQNKKEKITIEKFLSFKPVRENFEWYKTDEKLVRIVVPKFKGTLGKKFCKIMGKQDTFTANLDKIGSMVWENCDGSHTVKDILDILEKEFPKEENLLNRLIIFLQQMKRLKYISY